MNFSALHEKLNQYINKGRLKSPWGVHYDCGSCNGCDIEVLACLTPVFDVERFGIVNIGDPKHADVLLVTGTVNQRNKDVLKNIYDQLPEPKAVIAIGACREYFSAVLRRPAPARAACFRTASTSWAAWIM